MKLIVGLGNPGKEYEYTRHNIGFMVIDSYLGNVKYKNKFNAFYYEKKINSEKYIFIKPLTFMNLSGNSIIQFVKYYNIKASDILVIHDDLDLEMGKFRLKEKSSAGGHNGIKSIISNLKTEDFARLKIGISSNKDYDTKEYVLSKFTKNEINLINENLNIYYNIIEDFAKMDFYELTNKYNRRG